MMGVQQHVELWFRIRIHQSEYCQKQYSVCDDIDANRSDQLSRCILHILKHILQILKANHPAGWCIQTVTDCPMRCLKARLKVL